LTNVVLTIIVRVCIAVRAVSSVSGDSDTVESIAIAVPLAGRLIGPLEFSLAIIAREELDALPISYAGRVLAVGGQRRHDEA
jgi:hypothetical protein